jgi:DNA repair protein RecO (recombination protein O)
VALLRDEAVVLRTYRLGEADRIIVAVTKEHGKVRAVAKGVRKTSSKFGARLEPLTHVSLILWRGRSDLDVVNQAETIERYWQLREDLTRMSIGLSMLEVIDQVTQEGQSDARLFDTLTRALGVLDDPSRDPTLIAPAFFLRVLELEGAGPVVDVCVSCGDEQAELVAFDLTEGGVLCRSCRRGRPLSSEALALLRRIVGGDLSGVLAGAPPEGASELDALATEAMEVHLDRRLKAVHAAPGI